MARTGLLKELAEKTGKTISEIKRAIMKAATHVYRKMLDELGLTKGNAKFYFEVLRHSLPVTWRLVREKKTIPTPEEVYAIVVREWPTWKEAAERLLGAKVAA